MRRDATLLAYILLTVLGLWTFAEQAAPFRGPASDCRLGYVYDGDTVELHCGAQRRTGRLQGVDTPETKTPRCPAESALGQRATARLRALVKSGEVRIYLLGHDRYGRDLVRLTVAGRDAGAVLIAEGLARPYHGGARAGWCD